MAKNRKVAEKQHSRAIVDKGKKPSNAFKKNRQLNKKNSVTDRAQTGKSMVRKGRSTQLRKENHTQVTKKRKSLSKVGNDPSTNAAKTNHLPNKISSHTFLTNVNSDPSCSTPVIKDNHLNKVDRKRRLPERASKQKSYLTSKRNEDSNPIIGIDLGTTNTVAAVWNGKDYEVIADEKNNKLTPSMVFYYGANGKVEVGAAAFENALDHPKALIHDSKRFIGRSFSEAPVVGDYKWYPLTLSAEHGHVTMQVQNGNFKEWVTPKDAAAAILTHVAKYVSKSLGKRVKDIVVTVPSNFTLAQKQATSEAAREAGLHVLQILNEPTAAAMAYTKDLNLEEDEIKTIFVFDMGGSTLDICVMEVSRDSYQTVAMAGHERIGGKNFDLILFNYCVEEYTKEKQEKHGKLSKVQVLKLHKACEEAKIKLSNDTEVTVEIPLVTQKSPFKIKLQRTIFSSVGKGYLAVVDEMIKNALQDAKMNSGDIDDVLLVGGATRMPCIMELVQKHFFANRMIQKQNVDEIVAIGAAILGQSIRKSKMTGRAVRHLHDVTPISLGVSVFGGTMEVMVPRFTHLPTQKCKLFTTTSGQQTVGIIRVLEGENSDSKKNKELAKINFDGITKGPRGMASILITFEVNGNNEIRVSVVDSDSMNRKVVRISSAARRTRAEAPVIRKRVKQTREDKKFHREMRDLVYYLNKIKLTVYDLDDLLSKVDGGLTVAQKKVLKKGLAPFQNWLGTRASRTFRDVRTEWNKLYKFCVNLPTEILQKSQLQNLPTHFKKDNQKPTEICEQVKHKIFQEKRQAAAQSSRVGSKKVKIDDFYCRPGTTGSESNSEVEEQITTSTRPTGVNNSDDDQADNATEEGTDDMFEEVGMHESGTDSDSLDDEIPEEEEDDTDDGSVNFDGVTDEEENEKDQIGEANKNKDDDAEWSDLSDRTNDTDENGEGEEGLGEVDTNEKSEAPKEKVVADALEVKAADGEVGTEVNTSTELNSANGTEQNGQVLAVVVQAEDKQ